MNAAIEPGVRAVIFDWAGTIVDHGSRAPLEAFRRIFEEIDLELTDEEIRGPMGLGKREHIAALLGLTRVAARHRGGHHLHLLLLRLLHEQLLHLHHLLLPSLHGDGRLGGVD